MRPDTTHRAVTGPAVDAGAARLARREPPARRPVNEFLRRFLGMVESTVRLNPRLSEHEIRSKCLEALWLNQTRIESADNPQAMARIICRRRALDLYRKKARACRSFDAVAETNLTSAGGGQPTPDVSCELGALLSQLGARCTPTQWMVLVDMLRGVPRADTARRLTVSGPRVSQIRRQVHVLARTCRVA